MQHTLNVIYRGETIVEYDISWSSAWHAAEASTEWATVDLGSSQLINKVKIKPRFTGANAISFPRAFVIQTSTDGVTWTAVPGQTYLGYYFNTNAGSKWQLFLFNNLVNARYVRVYATKLNPDTPGGSNYYMHLKEIVVE